METYTDARLDRIESKLDNLQCEMSNLWKNGLAALDKRVVRLEAEHEMKVAQHSDRNANSQRYLTIIGWIITALNSLGIGLAIAFINHLGKT